MNSASDFQKELGTGYEGPLIQIPFEAGALILAFFVLAVVSLVVTILAIVWWKGRLRNREAVIREKFLPMLLDVITHNDASAIREFDLSFRTVNDARAFEDLLRECCDVVAGAARQALREVHVNSGLQEARIRELSDGNVFRRQLAADVLGVLGLGDAGDALAHVLNDDDIDVRFIAVRSLGSLEASGHAAKIASLLDTFEEHHCPLVADVLIRFGAVSALPLISALESPHEHTRYWSLRALAHLDIFEELGDALRQRLQELTSDDSRRLRAALPAVMALVPDHGAGGPARSNSDLLSLSLADNSLEVRLAAVRAMGANWKPQDLQVLAQAMRDRSWEVGGEAASKLPIAGEEGINVLIEGLEDERPVVRWRCAETLELSGRIDMWISEALRNKRLKIVRKKLVLAARNGSITPFVELFKQGGIRERELALEIIVASGNPVGANEVLTTLSGEQVTGTKDAERIDDLNELANRLSEYDERGVPLSERSAAGLGLVKT